MQGGFIWHDHKDTDETFIVVEGELRIDFRDGCVYRYESAGGAFVADLRVNAAGFAIDYRGFWQIECAAEPKRGGV